MTLCNSRHPVNIVEYVTALYPGPSKHDMKSYESWIRRLFRATQRNVLHFYVPSWHLAERLKSLGASESVCFHVLEHEQLPGRRLRVDWKEQIRLDPEREIHRNSDHIYVIWSSKAGLTTRVADTADPNTLLFWVDAGYVRSCRTERLFASFPRNWQVDAVASGGVHFLAVDAFSSDELVGRSCATPNDFAGKVRVGGGMFGALPNAWSKFTREYEHFLERWSQGGQFVGMDQYVFTALVLRRPDLATAWTVTRRFGNPWFDLPTSLGRRRGA